MTQLINIRRDVTDTFYRYKMERIQTKIEGKGNGIKTVITNLSSIANSLAREGNVVIKYFGFELGAQTNMNPSDDRWIINGAHEASKLQDSLDGFINKFVLCKKCKNPETDFVFKDGGILLDCKACGQRSTVDIRLKLSGFILKNQEKKGKSSKAERKAARKAKQNGNGNGYGNGKDNGSGSDDKVSDHGNDNEENGIDGSDEDPNGISNAESPVAADDKEHEWTVDMDPAAVKARQLSLPDEFKQKVSLDDDEDGEGVGYTVYDQLGDWIQSHAQEKGSIDKVDDVQVYLKAKELGIESKHRTVLVLVQTLFDHNILTQVPKRASMLKQVIGESEKHEKALLGGTERLISSLGEAHPELYTQVAKILQLYHYHNLLSEEVATKWGTRASKKYVDLATSKKIRKAAEPFLRWLEEAEEDSEEEE